MMQMLIMMAKLVKSMSIISKQRANRISQSHNLVATDIIDKIVKTKIKPTNK